MKSIALTIAIVLLELWFGATSSRLRQNTALAGIASHLPANRSQLITGGLLLHADEAELLVKLLEKNDAQHVMHASRRGKGPGEPCQFDNLEELVAKLQDVEAKTIVELEADVATAKQSIADAYAEFEACDKEAIANRERSNSAFDTNKKKHDQCRSSESKLKLELTICSAEKNALKTPMATHMEDVKREETEVRSRSCSPPGENDDVGAWLVEEERKLKDLLDRWESATARYNDAKEKHDEQDCDSRSKELLAKRASCDNELKKLEASSCKEAQMQMAACNACYSAALQGYEKAKAQVTRGMTSRRKTWRANKEASCVLKKVGAKLQVATGDDTLGNAMHECDTDLDYSPLDIPFRPPPDDKCHAGELYPCTDTYNARVYGGSIDGVSIPECKTQCHVE